MAGRQGQALGSIFGDARGRVPRSPAAPGAAPLSALLGVLDRLEATLDAETAALMANAPADFGAFGNRKRQGLLEMTRALRTVSSAGQGGEIRERLRRFAAKLEHNRVALGTHLGAVREVADIISQTIKDAESDGTYSALAGRM